MRTECLRQRRLLFSPFSKVNFLISNEKQFICDVNVNSLPLSEIFYSELCLEPWGCFNLFPKSDKETQSNQSKLANS